MNAQCAWTGDPHRPLDRMRDDARRHLEGDAEIAEELAIRYADATRGHRSGRYAGDAAYAAARAGCMESLVDAAAAAHGVVPQDLRDAVGKRPPGVDLLVLLSFAAVYIAAAIPIVRRLRARFSADDLVPAIVAAALATMCVSACGVMAFVLWSNAVEIVRVGNGHLSYRAGRLPWSRHTVALYGAGAVSFMAIVLTRYAPLWLRRTPSDSPSRQA